MENSYKLIVHIIINWWKLWCFSCQISTNNTLCGYINIQHMTCSIFTPDDLTIMSMLIGLAFLAKFGSYSCAVRTRMQLLWPNFIQLFNIDFLFDWFHTNTKMIAWAIHISTVQKVRRHVIFLVWPIPYYKDDCMGNSHFYTCQEGEGSWACWLGRIFLLNLDLAENVSDKMSQHMTCQQHVTVTCLHYEKKNVIKKKSYK